VVCWLGWLALPPPAPARHAQLSPPLPIAASHGDAHMAVYTPPSSAPHARPPTTHDDHFWVFKSFGSFLAVNAGGKAGMRRKY
jgi:hypothetical protein